MVRHCQMGHLRADRSRRIRHHPGQYRDHEKQRQSGHRAPARRRRRQRQAARPGSRMGGAGGARGGQLRRDLPAQCRRRFAAEARARPQRAVEQGWADVRAANSLVLTRAAIAGLRWTAAAESHGTSYGRRPKGRPTVASCHPSILR